ncbi:hypothetical protein BV25DRAFT_242015 [Artomyces pyxidatus]|uniref:Uncharacterized protein n=1 Tax=Artomyces pyxidatus TaxID=48021 RepID=A0ACB8T8K6_9AGAM|nr:hypothetical protein BV25DRAFT_242015 [Artomyces pyxidatus]
MKVYTIGGSRNIGYYASLRLLRKGAVVTYLLRNTGVFDADESIQEYVKTGKARLVKGDALSKEDVRHGWEVAGQPDPTDPTDTDGVDILLFTVGGTPSFSPLRGFVINPPDLCTRCCLNAVSTLPRSDARAPPRIVAVTSVGLSKPAHKSLPLPLRIMYSALLGPAHEDKKGVEYILTHCSGDAGPRLVPSEKILAAGWERTEGVPGKGEVPGVVLVRPALLTDGECRADKNGPSSYRSRGDGDLAVPGGYTISRKDVGYFVAERLLGEDWEQWAGKGVSLAY